MNNLELSNEFDSIINSYPIIGGVSIVLDEYEKSIFLTQAEEDIVVSLYNGKLGNSFEETEELRKYLASLVKTHTSISKVAGITGLSKSSVFFKLPDDVLFVTYESVTFDDPKLDCANGKEVPVVPVTQDSYSRVNKNPFKRAGTSRALRLDVTDNMVEIISEYKIKEYLVRYITKPEPIVLIDLPNGLSVNGVSTETECKLIPIIHRLILNRAVQLALISKSPINNK